MGNARRIAAGLALGALATPLLAGSVLAASPRHEAVAGNYTLPTAAQTCASWLGTHGFKGYVVEHEKTTGMGQHQVERTLQDEGCRGGRDGQASPEISPWLRGARRGSNR